MLKQIINGIFAGVLISIGGAVYLSCDNKYVGSLLFTVALVCICYQGYSLYTGKICYIPEKHTKAEFSVLFTGLLGNVTATTVCGYALAYAVPKLRQAGFDACSLKIEQEIPQTLIRAFFCGILIYLAVDIFKKNKTPLGILLCIPTFILSGYEHSVADMFYFAVSGIVSLKAFVFIWLVILGNSAGGMLLPLLSLAGGKKVDGQKS